MPVVLENGSENLRTWLDPSRTEWNKELQSLLMPFKGDLECYQVSKDVGKVGNNSPDFIVPITSSQNKNNIANFFANAKRPKAQGATETFAEAASNDICFADSKAKKMDHLPNPKKEEQNSLKRRQSEEGDTEPPRKLIKNKDHASSTKPGSPLKSDPISEKAATQKKLRSATSNGTTGSGSPKKVSNGSQKITSFFGK